MAYKLTPDDVRGVAKHLSRKHDARIIDKDDAVEMKLVGSVLGKLGIVNKKHFMNHFSTTIPAGKLFRIRKARIYLPFEPGETKKNSPSLEDQAENIVHEFHHTRQDLVPHYIKTSKRAWLEARAMHAELEMCWFLRGRLPNLDLMAGNLRYYAVDKADIKTTAEQLKIVSYNVRRGKLHNRVSKDAIAYLKRRRRAYLIRFK
jgi:hypothetical protein